MTELTRTRGDTHVDEFAITSKKTGAVVDITGASFLLTLSYVSSPYNSAKQIYQLTGTITDAENGVVEFAPSAVQADIVGTFYYDVQMTDALGKIRTIEKGVYTYTQDITK